MRRDAWEFVVGGAFALGNDATKDRADFVRLFFVGWHLEQVTRYLLTLNAQAPEGVEVLGS